ncbi:MAG TPA: hypothetical protein VFU29_07710 [Chitinophagaceae bacterium]|nr:hypothetical protein [Chitinophagaceae bacterium]
MAPIPVGFFAFIASIFISERTRLAKSLNRAETENVEINNKPKKYKGKTFFILLTSHK